MGAMSTSSSSPGNNDVEERTSTDTPKERYGFPKENGSSRSHWLHGVEGDELLDHRTTPDLPILADIVIIGSGLTGTSIARYCLITWPKKSVVVLEAREFCSGATGRNAGHCKPDQFRGFKKYQQRFGTQQAVQILRNEGQTWSDLVQYVRENDVDCDLWVGDTIDVPMTPAVADIAKNVFESFKAAGGKVDHIKVTHDPAEAAKLTRIKDAQACYAWPASTLQPWKLTAHIMRENLKKGLNLQTHTKVTSVKEAARSPRSWVVETNRGEIECTQVVHATNAYSSALEPFLRGLIWPTPHICHRVIPPAAFSGIDCLKNSYGILMPGGRFFSINPRSTSDRLVMFGGSNPGQGAFEEWLEEHPDRCIDDGLTSFESISSAIQTFAETQFPGWTDNGEDKPKMYEDGWSGIMALSTDGVPLIGELPGLPGQWICAGHNGHGMARIFTAAPGLVKLMDGKSWGDTDLPDAFQLSTARIERLRKDTATGRNLGVSGSIASIQPPL